METFIAQSYSLSLSLSPHFTVLCDDYYSHGYIHVFTFLLDISVLGICWVVLKIQEWQEQLQI